MKNLILVSILALTLVACAKGSESQAPATLRSTVELTAPYEGMTPEAIPVEDRELTYYSMDLAKNNSDADVWVLGAWVTTNPGQYSAYYDFRNDPAPVSNFFKYAKLFSVKIVNLGNAPITGVVSREARTYQAAETKTFTVNPGETFMIEDF